MCCTFTCSVQYGCFLRFLHFLISRMLLGYILNDSETVLATSILYWSHFSFFTIHMGCITIVRFVYFRILSASFLTTFLSPEIATPINIHVLFLLSRIMMSGLLLGVVPPFCTCWFHNMVTLPSGLVSIDFSTSSYHCSLHNITPIFLA